MAIKRQNPVALYMQWQNLEFDPAKDDIEDFCNDVKNLAKQTRVSRGCTSDGHKVNIPPVLVTQVINVTTFKEIRDTLTTLVKNPVMKRFLMTDGMGEKGLASFNMFQVHWQPKNDTGMCDSGIGSMHGDEGSRRTPKSIGKIMNNINDLEFRMCKMSTSDNQSHEAPYKPQVAPPRHQGGGSQNRGGFRNSSQGQSHCSRGNGSSFGRNSSGYSSDSSSGYNPSRSERSMSGQG